MRYPGFVWLNGMKRDGFISLGLEASSVYAFVAGMTVRISGTEAEGFYPRRIGFIVV